MGSTSREVTAAFVTAWREQHPDGEVVYRGLAEVDFMGPELTPAHSKPEMAEPIPSRTLPATQAFTDAAEKAKALAVRLAA
ncbi:hypothetical protein ABZ638_00795 [Streptomyces sp. NPDC007107]|uniref:hypothetical protein n=1 Tax=Streptomyces sp. NPDC007107 TaxID=3156915 RepID=UPI0033D92DCF